MPVSRTLVVALVSLLPIAAAAQAPANLKGITGIAVHVDANGAPNVPMTQLEGQISSGCAKRASH